MKNMTKNLLYLFLFLSGISLFQSKIKLTEESESAFFCDTNVPLNVQVSNVTLGLQIPTLLKTQ